MKVQDTIPICASHLSQIVALGALSNDNHRDWVKGMVSTLLPGRDAILAALEPLDKIVGGDGAMYVMGKLPSGLDDLNVASILVEYHGVAVIPGSYCGSPGWIRVCYANLPPEKCLEAASRLAGGIREICDLSLSTSSLSSLESSS